MSNIKVMSHFDNRIFLSHLSIKMKKKGKLIFVIFVFNIYQVNILGDQLIK